MIPDLFLEAEPLVEKFRVSLNQFMIPYNWYQVNEGLNAITIFDPVQQAGYTAWVPPGTYNYFDLCGLLQGFLNTPVSYLETQNKVQITTDVPKTITFSQGIAQILGFEPDVPYTTSVRFPDLVSPNVCRPLATESIHVRITNLPCLDEAVSLTNVTGSVTVDDTVGIVPVANTRPFHVINYLNQTDDGNFTGDYKLTYLEFLLTNEDGLELTYLPDFTMTLKIDTVMVNEDEELMNVLRKMQADINDLLIAKALRAQAR